MLTEHSADVLNYYSEQTLELARVGLVCPEISVLNDERHYFLAHTSHPIKSTFVLGDCTTLNDLKQNLHESTYLLVLDPEHAYFWHKINYSLLPLLKTSV